MVAFYRFRLLPLTDCALQVSSPSSFCIQSGSGHLQRHVAERLERRAYDRVEPLRHLAPVADIQQFIRVLLGDLQQSRPHRENEKRSLLLHELTRNQRALHLEQLRLVHFLPRVLGVDARLFPLRVQSGALCLSLPLLVALDLADIVMTHLSHAF
jgi:hypothetical protein